MTIAAVCASDAVTLLTVCIAAEALRAGDIVPLRWRQRWLALHPGIVRPWHQRLAEAEDAYLDLLRAADPEAERTAQRFLESAGLDPMTEDLPVGAVAAAFMVAGQTPRRSSDQ